MDFTQKMLERNHSSQTKLEPISENSPVQHNIVTTISSSSGSLRKRCGNNKVVIETTVSWSKLPPLSPSHAAIEVISDGTNSTDGGSESSEEKENESPDNARYRRPFNRVNSKLQRLGAIYSGSDDGQSVVQRTEDGFSSGESRREVTSRNTKPAGRFARLAALADTINQWEDDPRHFPVGKEAQGFSRSVSNQRLIYNYDENENNRKQVKFASPVKEPSPVKSTSPEKNMPFPVKSFVREHSPPKTRDTSPVKGRYGSPIQMGTAVIKGISNKIPSSSDEESTAPVMGVKQLRNGARCQSALSTRDQNRDTSPTKQAWCQRDHNRDHIPTKPAWCQSAHSTMDHNRDPSPTKQAWHQTARTTGNRSGDASPTKQTRDPAELPLAERMALFERRAGPAVLPKAPLTQPLSRSQLQARPDAGAKATSSKTQPLSSGPLQERLALFEKGSDRKSNLKGTLTERQQELDMLKQRNKNKDVTSCVKKDEKPSAPPVPPPLPSPPEPFEFGRSRGSDFSCSYGDEDEFVGDWQPLEPEEAYPGLKEVRKVRLSPPQPGRLYPSLLDEETDGEKYYVENYVSNRSSTSTSSSKDSDVSGFENFAKLSKTNLKREWSASESSAIRANEIDDLLDQALDISSDDTSPPKRSYDATLKPLTPVRRVEINPSYLEESFDHTDAVEERDLELAKQKIERLRQEVSKQETYIFQASQALDLCYSTFEFSGSTELLEAEKLLLLACERRRALVQEIQRLRQECRLYPGGNSLTERGSITVSHLTLPLKMDVVHLAAKDDECYYLLCVVRHNEALQCSEIVSTRRSLHSGNKITFPDTFTVGDLYNDFKINIEVYGMKARHKELIPHDVKYHINTNKKEVSRLRLTPRKAKPEPRVAQSSSGRTSAFTLAGHLTLTLRDLHRTQFTLVKNKHVYNSVVEGPLTLRVQSEMRADVEYRGFLTMFEDVSGLGAWHRRWCLLKGDKLSYWRYPDDERKKVPLDTLELSQCTVKEAEVVRRDVCARPNTLQLFTVRPARATDTESLVVTRRGDRTCIRHWLSADTREERDQWCHHLNKALALMRAWGVSTAL